MDSKLLENMLSEMMLHKISGPTLSVLSEEFLKARAYLEGSYGIDAYSKERRDFQRAIETKSGLLESWISLTILSNFVAGFAAGREHQSVTESDVRAAVESMCDRYPECYWMRLKSTIKVLPDVSRWYDTV